MISLPKKPAYKVNVPYAVTLSPCDRYQFAESINRFSKFRNFWHGEFISSKFKYDMYIEISEPLNQKMLLKGTLGPRLHLHGVIMFRNNKELGEFLLHTIHQWLKYSNVYIHTIDHSDVWQGYYNKQKLYKKNRLSNYSQ